MILELERVGAGKRSRKSASSSKSVGIGQFSPASLARRRYSPTVLWEMEQLRAIARFVNPHSHFKRRTSRILRMVNLSWDIFASLSFWRQRMPQNDMISQRRFLFDQIRFQGFRSMPSTDSKPRRPLIPMSQKKWTPYRRNCWSAWSGTVGRHPSDSLVGMARITQCLHLSPKATRKVRIPK